jgi:D-arabinose 1-dehydrogenase-like Zn-dependent alcohol dehydrogenase
MRAAVFEGVRKPLVVRDMPDPHRAPDGAVIRVEANGICRTDWHLWTGDWTWVGIQLPTPHVFGHEFCGVVEETGANVKNWKSGDRVLVPFSQGEGTLRVVPDRASQRLRHAARAGRRLLGGSAPQVAVPYADVNLVRLPETVAFTDAASMGCRYMTAFHALVDQAEVRPGEWVAVHGCGGVGLSAVQIAAAMGANVIAVDVSDEKLAAAKGEGRSTRSTRARTSRSAPSWVSRAAARTSRSTRSA